MMAMPGDFRIICTDRGQHPAVQIRAYMKRFGPEGFVVGKAERATSIDDLQATQGRNHGGRVTGVPVAFPGKGPYYCRRCGRDPLISPERLAVAVNGMLAAGRDTLDLSQLGN